MYFQHASHFCILQSAGVELRLEHSDNLGESNSKSSAGSVWSCVTPSPLVRGKNCSLALTVQQLEEAKVELVAGRQRIQGLEDALQASKAAQRGHAKTAQATSADLAAAEAELKAARQASAPLM